jgi:hypothetical protein
LKDDGIVNTSDALVAADFRREFTRSLLDRRHRFAFSGTFDLPKVFGSLRLSTVLRLASGAPFNLGLGGADRNLDDVGTIVQSSTAISVCLNGENPAERLTQVS